LPLRILLEDAMLQRLSRGRMARLAADIDMLDRPVMLPPGRARLATYPSTTGSIRPGEHDGNGVGRALQFHDHPARG
jgi:hypothetical protein